MTPACRAPAVAVLVAVGCLAAAGLLAAQPPSPGAPAPAPPRYELRGIDALVRAYDFILEARFDQVDAELRRACGPAPPVACHVLEATALWWRIQLDPESRALDQVFTAAVERAIRTAEEWTTREPQEPEAWFYLGGAYGARVQWRVLRGEKLAAARDGKRIKEALERAVALEPRLYDAYFGLGLYKYYADVAPAAARILRFLLLLPGGDRDEGLGEMLRARNRGRLLQGEADYQLHLIYLWYEEETDRAVEILETLRARYPGNPLFSIQLAHISEAYRHDIIETLETWTSLLAAARAQRVNHASLAEVYARLGAARMLDRLHLTDDARGHLQAVVAAKPKEPQASLALAHLRLGEAHDRLGARTAAVAAYKAAIAATPPLDPYGIRSDASAGLRRRPDPQRTEAFRLSLEGWRRLEAGDLPGASAALERAVSLDPGDAVTRYRYGRVLQARRQDARALEQFEVAAEHASRCPAPILAEVYLEAGRLYERLGRRDRARSSYTVASTLFGASDETRAAAGRALERLAPR